MRWALVVIVMLLVGCASAPPAKLTAPASSANASATTPTANATTPIAGGLGERGSLATERFVLKPDRTFAIVDPSQKTDAESSVPESFVGVAFFTSTDPSKTLAPWVGPPAVRTFEAMGEVPITVKFKATQAAAAFTNGMGFPPVGGWFGTTDRWAVYVGATDAPQTLDAGKTYTVKMTAKLPPSGFFVRAGEHLALHLFLSYQTADDSPLSYVVGGQDPAGFALPHVHFNLTAPTATVVLDKSGTLSPNPGVSTTQDPQPSDLAFDVPAGSLYLLADVAGTPTGSGKIDVDMALRTAGGDVLGEGGGPSAHEIVELGPTALAKAGGKMVAHVAGATASGGSFKLTVTAYGP